MVTSNAGAKSGKRLPAPPPLLTAQVAAFAPKDLLGQLVIASNFCTITS